MLDRSHPDENVGAFRLLGRLLSDFGRDHVRGYALSALLLALISLSNTGVAAMLKPVLNGMVSAEKFGEMRTMAFEVVALFVLRGAATFGSTLTLSRIGNRIVATAQRRVFDRLLNQNLMFFQDRHSSEFVARLVIAANGVRDSLQLVVQSGARDLLTVVGLGAVMIYQDPLVAVGAVCALPILIFFIRKIIDRVRRFAKRSFQGSTQIMQTMSETVLGARIIKAFNLESEMRERMTRSVRTVESSANRIAVGNGLTAFLADSLAGLAIGFAVYYGSWRVSVQHADVGSFVSFLGALLLAYEPAKRLSGFWVNLQNGMVGTRMIYEVLDAPLADAPHSGAPALQVTAGRLTLEGARFAYRSGEYALDGVDLVAEPSQTTALVGPSGGGKSTILGVIQRFYALSDGRATIDGQDVAAVDLASLRAKIAFVSQDVFLFRGTIRDNIALGRIGATEAEIVEAARRANAHDFIMSFADGYDSSVGEQGTQLSGGQRQRIAIARAMLKNAPILLLDEPTAALDSESEREVQTALDALRIGRTTMVVAHRLQTIVGADRIFVIEKGRAIESGSHKELVARGGAYCAFFAAQFGLGALTSESPT
ncbi:MAG: ABC transporter ATP-binding protein [Roseiarcus sp.]|uniref:ABC transporter ATP-binding protein n=1 Tax=Roseiarcus sp. TaxID=1969460 RepID=UPI003C24ED27